MRKHTKIYMAALGICILPGLLFGCGNKNGEMVTNVRNAGVALYNAGDYNGAIAQLSQLDTLGDKGSAMYLDGKMYLGACYFENGNYQEAIGVYNEILTSGKFNVKDLADAYFMCGAAYVKTGNENAAVTSFEEALKLTNDDYELCTRMYAAFDDAGNKDRAESYLRRLLNVQGVTDILAGKTYYIIGEYETAEKYLLKAKDDGVDESLYYLAMAYDAQGKFTKAEEAFRDYMSKHPDDMAIYNQYAAYLMNTYNYPEAIKYIEEGLGKGEGEGKQALIFNRAICYEYIGDFAKAKEIMAQYVKDYPSDQKAQREFEFLSSR